MNLSKTWYTRSVLKKGKKYFLPYFYVFNIVFKFLMNLIFLTKDFISLTQVLSREVLYSKRGCSISSLFPVIFTQICKHRKTKNQGITLLFFCGLQYSIKFFSLFPIWILLLMMPRGGKKFFFFMFSKTYININLKYKLNFFSYYKYDLNNKFFIFYKIKYKFF